MAPYETYLFNAAVLILNRIIYYFFFSTSHFLIFPLVYTSGDWLTIFHYTLHKQRKKRRKYSIERLQFFSTFLSLSSFFLNAVLQQVFYSLSTKVIEIQELFQTDDFILISPSEIVTSLRYQRGTSSWWIHV